MQSSGSDGGTKNNYKIATQRQTRVFRSVRSLDKGFDTITLEWDEGFNGRYDKTTYNVEYKEIGGGS